MAKDLFKENDMVIVSGDSVEMGLKDYNCNVSTTATVLEDDTPKRKKLLVCLNNIDGDEHVGVHVNKKFITLLKEHSLLS